MKDWLTFLLGSSTFVLILYIPAIPLSKFASFWIDDFPIIPTRTWIMMFPILSLMFWIAALLQYKKDHNNI